MFLILMRFILIYDMTNGCLQIKKYLGNKQLIVYIIRVDFKMILPMHDGIE